MQLQWIAFNISQPQLGVSVRSTGWTPTAPQFANLITKTTTFASGPNSSQD
jgi:hypothetical protein